MTFEKVMSVLLSLFFLAAISFLGLMNKDTFAQSIAPVLEKADTEQRKTEEELKSELSSVEAVMKEKFQYKNEATDIYGLGLMAMNKKVVGNSEYIKSKSGLTVRFPYNYDTASFYNDIIGLNEFLKARDIPLIYIDVPYYDMTEKEAAASGYAAQRRKLTELFDNIQAAGIDTIEPDKEITDITPYFKTDVHFRTEYEFRIAQSICDKLMHGYNINIPAYNKVFDINNYDLKNYPFIGNTGRNSGRFFSGIDNFQIFHPTFETSMGLYIYDNGGARSGTYDEVCLNGYERRENINEYTYWVTNFLQFPRGHYEISNNSTEGPSILVIADSCMLRSMSYLSLATSNIKVLDIRMTDLAVLNNTLNEDYDAVVIAGISINFYASKLFYNAENDISGLDAYAVNEPVGYYGTWLDYYNDMKPAEKGIIEIDKSASTVSLSGWAVDPDNKNSLNGLYIKAGDKILMTNFGQERTSVVDYFDNPDYLKSGFNVTFSASLLYDDNGQLIDSIYFIPVAHDGSYMYEPVEYKLE